MRTSGLLLLLGFLAVSSFSQGVSAHFKRFGRDTSNKKLGAPYQAARKQTPQNNVVQSTDYTLIRTFERRTDLSYVQGFSYLPDKELILESSGYWGETAMRYVQLNAADNTVVTKRKLAPFTSSDFGEGSSLVSINGQIKAVLLTWTQRDVFVFDADLKAQEGNFMLNPKIPEGWGMTNMKESQYGQPSNVVLISDGSDKLYECDGNKKLEIVKTHRISDANGPISQMNELEYVGNDMVWANLYLSNDIVLIDLKTDKVIKRVNLTDLYNQATKLKNRLYGQYLTFDEVLNGIAYNPTSDTLYITGKRWPAIFEIKVNL